MRFWRRLVGKAALSLLALIRLIATDRWALMWFHQCEFHVKCMIAEGVLDGQVKKDVQHIRFSCSSCGGSLESNKPSGERRVGDQLPSITPSAPLKAVGKSGQKAGVHAQSSQQREAPQDP